MRIEDRTLDLSPEEGVRVVALGLLAEASDASEALAAGKGEEPLHDFRVAVRRLRSAIRAFRPWLEDSVRPRHEKRLRKLVRSTNEARDAEVQLAWLATQRSALPARRRAGYDAVVHRFEARGHSGPDAARVAERFERLSARLGRKLGRYERKVASGADAGSTFGALLASLVGDQVDVLAGAMAAVQEPADQEGVHRARIEGKRLRYLLEPLKGSRAADAKEVIGHLKRLQDLLGDLHDAHVLAGELREALADAAAGQAHLLHDAVLAQGADDGADRSRLRASLRPGILALVRLVRERRNALYADLAREWRSGGMATLAGEVHAVAAALEARVGGKLEHEHKYLLSALPARAADEPGLEIAQGWLPGAQLRERVRRVRGPDGERYWRAIKRGSGRGRLEAEEETTRAMFEALWPLTEGRRIAKRRRRIEDGSLVWEIDEFTDRDLLVAEVELPAATTAVALPDWLRPFVVRDVTDDPAYLNETLASSPGREPAPLAPSPVSASREESAPTADEPAPRSPSR
jgi:CHAD domain-containing protein/CYTH domain-containing protein